MSLWRQLRAYPDHADPRVAACNLIALVVAWNQPLYPFYVRWLVGGDAWAACWTFLSTPFFLAVPWVARRHPRASRILLLAAGLANTALSTKAFGEASAVQWFLLPCVLIALLAFRSWEGPVAMVATGLTSAVLLHGPYGSPLGAFTAEQYRHFASLNRWSAATLCLFVLWTLGRAAASQRRPQSIVVTQ